MVPPDIYAYRPATKSFNDLRIGTRGDIDPSAYTISNLEAKARDGTMVPLSLIERKGVTGPQITLIEAYGSYGISELADFSVRRAAAMREGITYGVCHVRGGGELGEPWRLGGKDANKHNTWEDLIACGEFLVRRGTTASNKLFILGGSAGGITVGRALTARPDLFAGAIDLVPASNTLRAEFSANGPPNVPEFGTVTTSEGFNNLYDMDTIAHIKDGVQYPAVMITTGLNDPRVSPWETAKLAAALLASGSSKPVLLRIEAEEALAAWHRLYQDADRCSRCGLDCFRVLARRVAGVATRSAALGVQAKRVYFISSLSGMPSQCLSLVTSAAGVNGDGYGALPCVRCATAGRSVPFSNDARIRADPRGLAVDQKNERSSFLNSGALIESWRSIGTEQFVPDTGPIPRN